MIRIYEPTAYDPKNTAYWLDTVDLAPWGRMDGDVQADVAIMGGGFTGLNAARQLAVQGMRVVVVDSNHPGWGASARNGGFCCIGGGVLPDAMIRRRFGVAGLNDWNRAKSSAVAYVGDLLSTHDIDADRCQDGETLLAHNARNWRNIQREGGSVHSKNDLIGMGMAGPWKGGVTHAEGFGLNPAKYLAGLIALCREAGVQLFQDAHVTNLTRQGTAWHLGTDAGTLRAGKVIIATNGYSSDDLPDWMQSRYMPLSSNVLVTRKLTDAELQAAGWTMTQTAYDSRKMLHYFRLLPEGRFLFGMRGGLSAAPRARARISAKLRSDFVSLFPAWQNVDITHEWSGLLSFTGKLLPFVGPVPDQPGLYASFGYHGNGVAMASYCGDLLGRHIANDAPIPPVLSTQPARFPFGRHRRLGFVPAYFLTEVFDL